MLIPVIQNGVDLFIDSAQIAIPWSSVFGRPAIVDTLSRLPNGAGVLVNDGAGNLAWASIGGGSVTSVGLAAPASFVVTGSPVTGAGTLTFAYAPGYVPYTSLESSKLATIAAGATVGATWGVNLFSRPAIITNLGALANAAGLLANDGAGNLSWLSPSVIGTVTQVNTGNGLLGGPITTSGTVYVDENYNFNWTGNHRFTAGFILDTPLFAIYGGTGFGSYTAGDFLYASSTTAFSKLAIGTAGDVLRVSGGAPAWQAVSTMAANPSASVGLAAVNGSASTFMRSDAAPALDQGIAPTWTARHIFTNSGVAGAIRIDCNVPVLAVNDADAAADNRLWWLATNGTFTIQAVNDAISAAGVAYEVVRSGAAITAINYGNSTNNPPHTFYGQLVLPKAGGASALDYPILMTSARPGINFNDTAAAADAGRWEWFVTGGTMYLRTINDASSLARPTMQFVRSASGIAITSQIYGNSTDNPIHLFNGSLSLATIATSTSASIGAATALPALPTGYITVTIGGAAKKIPYYDP